MHRLKNDNLPKIFRELLRKRNHKYPKRVFKKQRYFKTIPPKQYQILYIGSRTKVME